MFMRPKINCPGLVGRSDSKLGGGYLDYTFTYNLAGQLMLAGLGFDAALQVAIFMRRNALHGADQLGGRLIERRLYGGANAGRDGLHTACKTGELRRTGH